VPRGSGSDRYLTGRDPLRTWLQGADRVAPRRSINAKSRGSQISSTRRSQPASANSRAFATARSGVPAIQLGFWASQKSGSMGSSSLKAAARGVAVQTRPKSHPPAWVPWPTFAPRQAYGRRQRTPRRALGMPSRRQPCPWRTCCIRPRTGQPAVASGPPRVPPTITGRRGLTTASGGRSRP